MAAVPPTHRVVITPEALAHLTEIVDFIADQSVQNARVVNDRLLDAIQALDTFPTRCRRYMKDRQGEQIHAMTVAPFVVYYRVVDTSKAVFVLKIIRGARQQPRHF